MTICLPILMQQEQSGKSNRITMHELFFFFFKPVYCASKLQGLTVGNSTVLNWRWPFLKCACMFSLLINHVYTNTDTIDLFIQNPNLLFWEKFIFNWWSIPSATQSKSPKPMSSSDSSDSSFLVSAAAAGAALSAGAAVTTAATAANLEGSFRNSFVCKKYQLCSFMTN